MLNRKTWKRYTATHKQTGEVIKLCAQSIEEAREQLEFRGHKENEYLVVREV